MAGREPFSIPPGRTAQTQRAVLRAIIVSTLLGALKILAGVIGHSDALIADGAESILDLFSSIIVWSSTWMAAHPPDEKHPYGHDRAESLGTLIIAVGMIVTAIALALHSTREILTPSEVPAAWTLAVLVIVVVVKELLFRWLARVGKDLGSNVMRGDAWHHRADAITSLAALIGISIAVVGGTAYAAADDWAALAACVVIAWNGVSMLRIGVDEVMDTAAAPEIEAGLRETAGHVPGVCAVEKCRIRITGPRLIAELHVEVDPEMSVRKGHEIAHAVKSALLASESRLIDVLVHIEPAQSPAVPATR